MKQDYTKEYYGKSKNHLFEKHKIIIEKILDETEDFEGDVFKEEERKPYQQYNGPFKSVFFIPWEME